MNTLTLYARLTRDPELRVTPSGSTVCQFSVAYNRKYKDKEETSFFDVIAFGRTAELIQQYFTKGIAILFQGRLQQDRWEDKSSGQARSKVVIVVEAVTFTGKSEGAPVKQGVATKTEAHPEDNRHPHNIDEDVPF